MIRVSGTLSALAQKMANAHLKRTDTDLFYSAIVDHVRAIEDTFTENGVRFPDGTVQHTSMERVLGDRVTARASSKGLKGPVKPTTIPITLDKIEAEAFFMSFMAS